jgi:hypothetical protein
VLEKVPWIVCPVVLATFEMRPTSVKLVAVIWLPPMSKSPRPCPNPRRLHRCCLRSAAPALTLLTVTLTGHGATPSTVTTSS